MVLKNSKFKKVDSMETHCDNCIIRQFNSLKAMSADELKKVANLKTTKTIKKGNLVFKEGEKLDGVFCVRNGVSKLSKLSSNGKDQIVKLVGKGAVIGQRSVIVEECTNLSAVALCDMEVCFIPKEVITETINSNPNFAIEVLRQMAQDLKEADDVIVNMSQKSVKQRIAEAFLYLNDNYGVDAEGFLNLTLTREDCANIVGTATETCIRAISEFKKGNILKTNGKKIGIIDSEKLQEIALGS